MNFGAIVLHSQAGETGMSALRRFSRAGINIAATTMVTSAMKVCIKKYVYVKYWLY